MTCSRRACGSSAGFTLIEVMVVLVVLALTATFVTLVIDTSRQDDHEVERLRLVLEAAAERAQVTGTPLRIELLPQGYRFSRFDVQGGWRPVEDDPKFVERSLSSNLAWRGLEVGGERQATMLVFGNEMPDFLLRIGTPSGGILLRGIPTGVVVRDVEPRVQAGLS